MTLPVEEIARYPLPGMAIPGNVAFSPDGRLVTYLWSEEGSLTRQLYAFDTQTGEQRLLVEPTGGGATDENVSLEEALRRERQRQREFGVTAYAWAKDRSRLLVPMKGDIYAQDSPSGPLRLILDSKGTPALDPQLSPDGEWLAYAQDAELYLLPFSGGQPLQLTRGARQSGKTHGLAEYIAQEEMGRSHGFWWSPDSQRLAFEEVDESLIPLYRIIHQGKRFANGEIIQEDHHYPFAGGPNACVRLGVVSREGGDPIWMDLGEDAGQDSHPDVYLARVDWLPGGDLVVQVENRSQTCLDLYRYNPSSGQRTLLLREENPAWINLHNMFRPLKNEEFLWASERSGYRHLYLFNHEGMLVRQLTKGEWMVDDLIAVDEQNRIVYFTATLDSPLESQLYAVSLDGGVITRLTRDPGVHSVVIDPACQRFVDTWQSVSHPPTLTLRSLADGSPIRTIYNQVDPRVEELGLVPPELVSMHNRCGDLLYAAILRPPDSFGPGPYPTIVSVYGGPHAQVVTNSWALTCNMRAQYLRSLGYLVFMLDNRGSARRGLGFEIQIKGDMGHLEVDDQADGVRWLVEKGLADPQRVGIYGWSYGGYMAAMCLARAPENFKVAVAGAPVTHWDGYDTFYTERYMGSPGENPQGYEESSVMHHVEKIEGKLLLVHGMIDENVQFRHTARLINALIEARKPYDVLLFPDERHMPRKPADRVYMEQRISDYFVNNL